MSDVIGSLGSRRVPQRWDWIEPNNPLFAVIFPDTAERAIRNNWCDMKVMREALKELRKKIRGIMFTDLATPDAVEQIAAEVIVRAGKERPLNRMNLSRGNGGGLFYTFLRRRVIKEAKRLGRTTRTAPLEEALLAGNDEDPGGGTLENRELLKLVEKWMLVIPPKQASAIAKWIENEKGEKAGVNRLTKNEMTNRTRGLDALRAIARHKGLRP